MSDGGIVRRDWASEQEGVRYHIESSILRSNYGISDSGSIKNGVMRKRCYAIQGKCVCVCVCVCGGGRGRNTRG